MAAVLAAMGIITPMTNSAQTATYGTDPGAWIHLWQLISPSLPIGAYAYSQGLETAVEKNWINNESEALNWIKGILTHSLGKLDAPVLARLYQAWHANDAKALNYWNQFLLASRESSELYEEDQQMGRALWRLLNDILPVTNDSSENDEKITAIEHYRTLMSDMTTPGYAAIFALAAVIWKIPLQEGIRGFLWAWCENQVAASIKLIPLGQTAGQRILSTLIPVINESTKQALELSDDEIGALAPGFSIVCAQHEVQYSRLFRS